MANSVYKFKLTKAKKLKQNNNKKTKLKIAVQPIFLKKINDIRNPYMLF